MAGAHVAARQRPRPTTALGHHLHCDPVVLRFASRGASRPRQVRLVPVHDHRDPGSGRHGAQPSPGRCPHRATGGTSEFIAEFPNVRFFFDSCVGTGAVYVAASVTAHGEPTGVDCCSSSSRCWSVHSQRSRPACSRRTRGSRRSRCRIGRRQPKQSRRPAVVAGVGRQAAQCRPRRASSTSCSTRSVHRNQLVEQGREGTAQRAQQAPARQLKWLRVRRLRTSR